MMANTMERPKPRLKNLDELFNLSNETQDQDVFTHQPHVNGSEVNGKDGESHTILTIPLDLMDNFKKHPFTLYSGERRDDMINSIKTNGVLQPLILRPKENGRFEILSGHNRRNCAMEAGFDTAPAIIKENVTDDDALMYVIETNLIQRSFSEMSHSEKATVLSIQHSKLFSQGKRNDILEELKILENPHDESQNPTFAQNTKKHRSDVMVGEAYNLSKDTVARYLRIAKLTPALKQRLDAGEVPFFSAVALSFLAENEQGIVENCIELNNFKVDLKKSDVLRDYSARGKLTNDNVYLILNGELGQPPKKKQLPTKVISKAVFSKYFKPNQPIKEIQSIVEKALEQYFAALSINREPMNTANKQTTHVPDEEAEYDGEMNL